MATATWQHLAAPLLWAGLLTGGLAQAQNP